MRSEIFKILKGAVLGALFLVCGAIADEAKFKPMLLKEYVPGMNHKRPRGLERGLSAVFRGRRAIHGARGV